MFELSRFFIATRSILELLYFASGIAIAVAAIMALQQIRLTKQIARTNARRESVRMAADLCKYFAESVIPAWYAANDEYLGKGFSFLKVAPPQGQPPFAIKDGEIVNHHFNLKALADELPKARLAVNNLNLLEAFAIPLAAGVADEDIGYRETARSFCQVAQLYMPVLFQLRQLDSARFESIVTLYGTWTTRLAAEKVAPVMRIMEQLAKAGEARIKPLDQGY